jgi:hypothetical protein
LSFRLSKIKDTIECPPPPQIFEMKISFRCRQLAICSTLQSSMYVTFTGGNLTTAEFAALTRAVSFNERLGRHFAPRRKILRNQH